MESHIFNKLLIIAIDASIKAGREILEIYSSNDFDIKTKIDNSPLTKADQNAHSIISKLLSKTGIPVLSEEDIEIPFEIRKQWEYFWLVDPLDGTKEFINRNGEFTVNIALIRNGNPIIGVVYAPVLNNIYFASEKIGAFKISALQIDFDDLNIEHLLLESQKLPIYSKLQNYTVIGSRSHMNYETENYINGIRKQFGEIDFKSKGSSLKICMVAEGAANIYPRFGPTMEWDTAAGHAIALFAGCTFTQQDEITPLIYNKEELLNPSFIVKR